MPDSPAHYLGGRLLTWRLRPFFVRLEIGRFQWFVSTEGCTLTCCAHWWKRTD